MFRLSAFLVASVLACADASAPRVVCTNDCLQKYGGDYMCAQFCEPKYFDHDGACAYVPVDCYSNMFYGVGCIYKACVCRDGYAYDYRSGLCLIDDVRSTKVQRKVAPVSDITCQTSPSICTKDVNECGYPSLCFCDETLTYNSKTGLC